MAVKKKQNVDVQVDETVETPVETVEEPVEEVTEVAEEVEVTSPVKETEDTDGVSVDPEAFKVDEVNIPEEKEKKVKIRMRVDHHCSIAMVRYDLKAGKTYDVPANVKLILDNAGLLSPL